MPNDPLSSPDDAAQSREDAEDQAFVAANAPTERGQAFLTEYTSPLTETRRLLATIARLRSAVPAGRPTDTPAVFARALADVIAVIQQIEAMLAADTGVMPDVYFAIEHIQDIAMALRQRELDTALCDGLEGSIREIGDAVVRHDAAASRAAGAQALLHELRQRVDEMLTRDMAPADSSSHDQDLAAPPDERLPDIGADSDGGVMDLLHENAGALPDLVAPLHQALPQEPAKPAMQEPTARLFDRVALPIPSPIEEKSEARHPVEAELPLSARTDANPAQRVPAHDPLAVLQTLSEEELIALFS